MAVYTVTGSGFNLLYDYHRTGLGSSGLAVFTNESNSGFTNALIEMLIQSHEEFIHVFPAVPRKWKDISFENLRAEGAFLVSAERKNGDVSKITIHAERDGVIRLKNPWKKNQRYLAATKRFQ